MVRRDGARVRCFTRNGYDWAVRFPAIVEAASRIQASSFLIDGEACASGCISMRTSLEEGIKLHRFAGIFPEQFSTEAGRYREAVVAADHRMFIRCFRDDLAHFVHDVSHVPPPIQRTGPVDAPFWRHHEGRDRQSDAAEHLKGMAYHESGVAYLLVERTYSLSRPPSVPLRQRWSGSCRSGTPSEWPLPAQHQRLPEA